MNRSSQNSREDSNGSDYNNDDQGTEKQNKWGKAIFYEDRQLYPSEGVWNILKQRMRRLRYSNVKELKRVILEKWNKISMDEIRAWIREMPERCKQVKQSNGGVYKSSLWYLESWKFDGAGSNFGGVRLPPLDMTFRPPCAPVPSTRAIPIFFYGQQSNPS